jgi:P27 family predicted phage terminase small subunit
MRKKPTQLKKIDGTYRKDRAKFNEPKPKLSESLDPPIELDEHGRAFWNYHAPKLQKLNLLTECDTYSLALASEWWSVHRRAVEGLRSDLVHETESNGECCRPELTAAKQAFTNLQILMQRFGLDPQSRSKISVPSPEEKDPIRDLYFKRPRPVVV